MTAKGNSRHDHRLTPAAKQLALVFIPACALLAWIGKVQTDRPLDAADIKIEASRLRSLSSEMKLLTEHALGARVSADYFDVHASMLSSKVDDTRKALDSSPPSSGLESQL